MLILIVDGVEEEIPSGRQGVQPERCSSVFPKFPKRIIGQTLNQLYSKIEQTTYQIAMEYRCYDKNQILQYSY
jgi:hypothetical protein